MRIVSTLTLLASFLLLCLLTIVKASPFEDKIQIRLYKNSTTDYEQAPISHGEQLFQKSKGYNRSLPLVLLIHGVTPKGANCSFVNGTVEAFVKRQLTNEYNIFAVDMPELLQNSIKNQFYFGILAHVQPAGQWIGEFLGKVINLKLTEPESINIIGYSMGAQVAGYAARAVKNRFGEINFIAGLDPAGPGFHTMLWGRPTLVHVSAADARTTHFYHTNSISCGTRDRVATADFVFNKGTVQPGCSKDSSLECSHVRVRKFYIEAVTNPKSFVARKCSSWEEFNACDCNTQATVPITFPPDTSAKGIYYLRTRAKSRFALGKRGSRCNKTVHIAHEKDIQGTTQLGDKFTQSKITSEINYIKDSLNIKHKLKDSMNMHLINGIRRMEDLQRPEVHEQLDPSDGEGAKMIVQI